MTLETAKKIVAEGFPNKEAEAVVRGGMTICETKNDGSRNYQWVKVRPTADDSESSIKKALDKYWNKEQARTSKDQKVTIQKQGDIPQKPKGPILKDEPEIKVSQYTRLERLKKKAKDIWKEIDSIVVE